MSLTRTVPDLVPSDFHSSRPWMASSAVKNTFPPTSVSPVGLLGRVSGSLHHNGEAAALRMAPSADVVTAAVDAPTPASVTAAAIAAARLDPTPRARRRSTFARATRNRTAVSLAQRRRRIIPHPFKGGTMQGAH